MTRILPPTPETLAEAAQILRAGRLVAFPTETVYGLGCLGTSNAAVARVYDAKRRPAHNPLIMHVADLKAAMRIAHFGPRARHLASQAWPGPLTLVLPRRAEAGLSGLALAGLETVALRVPGHPVAQALLRAVAAPVAGPSANPSGRVSPTLAAHVAQDLAGRVDLVIDGGACPVGLESTVIDLTDENHPSLLRAGGMAREAVEAVIGAVATGTDAARPASPGQLASHYAPRLPVRLDAVDVSGDEALLAFGPAGPGGARVTLNLSKAGDLAEAARNLYAMMRALDESGASGIAVSPIPMTGLGAALNDRLRRAAAPRP